MMGRSREVRGGDERRGVRRREGEERRTGWEWREEKRKGKRNEERRGAPLSGSPESMHAVCSCLAITRDLGAHWQTEG